jgi:septal ring factor EnvC (AmiA/AmiB activator)
MKLRLSIFLILFCLALSASAQSSKRKELENIRKSLLLDIENTNKLLTNNEKTTKNVFNRINILAQQIQAREKIIQSLSQEINILDEEISNKERQILLLEKEIQRKKKTYAASIQKMYFHKNKEEQFLFLLSANSISQSYQRILYLKKYSGWQKEKAGEIREKQNQIALEKQLLENDKSQKQKLVTEKTQEEKKLNEKENANKKMIESLKKDRKLLIAELKQKQIEATKLSSQIDKIIKDEIAASKKKASASQSKETQGINAKDGFVMTKEEIHLSSNFAANKGKLPFPLKGHYKIVETFGINRYPDFPGIELYCNGIEIETTPGNDATAVFDGLVVNVFTLQGYDNSILLRHGNYFTLYSNLGRTYVKKGDKIKTGQALGKIFTNELKGNSTLLHFEILKNQTNLNPMLWLNK